MELAIAAAAFAPALALGSFLNVVVARLPERRSLVHPRSACPACGHELAWYDNVPVVSYLLLRGRCRRCRNPIGLRYPLVELMTALLIAACFWRFGLTGRAFVASFFVAVLLVLSVIDLERRILPNLIVLPAAALVLGAQSALFPERVLEWIVASFGAAAFLFLAVLAYPQGMGMGDVKLALLLGAALGATVSIALLVGMLAALASKTGKVGFVGGMDIPLIRKFACGYVQGVKHAKKDAEVFQNMTGTTGAAWNDPVKGGELAKSQIDRGADVIYHAAGGTGVGVLRAAADAGKLGIGVDSNQNGMHPGKVLTSMVKRVDVATYNAFDQAKKGTFKPGVSVLGLKEEGVGWALDEHNKPLITPEMQAAADKAAADIKSGAIKVHDYMSDSMCEVLY